MTGVPACTLVELLQARACDRPGELALRLEHDGDWLAWSWQALWERSCATALAFRARGISAGDRVLVLVPEVHEAVPSLFALWRLGAVPIQVGVPFGIADVGALVAQLSTTAEGVGARALLLSPRLVPLAGRSAPVPVVPATVPADCVAGTAALPAVDPTQAPALIQLTSGSTGHPRGVVISNQRLMRHMAAMSAALPSHARSVAVSWLPLHHDMGLIGGLLFPFYNGFPAHMMSPATFRTRPLRWLEAMSRFRGTISAAPPSAFGVCVRLVEQARAQALDLSTWECAMVGAEPISPGLLRRFAAAFAPLGFRPQALFPVYGLAEATVAVTFPRPGTPPRFDLVERAPLEREGRARPARAGDDGATLEFTAVGSPIPETAIRILDEAGRDLAERTVGEIHVRSTSLMDGYLGDPAATAAVLADGWLATGDLGYVADGDLFVTGRRKDLIIKGGQNLLPAVVEEVAGADPDVRAGCVAAVGVWAPDLETELVVVVCETRIEPERRPAVVARLRERLHAFGIAVDRIVLVAPGVLPRTTSGKLRRRDVRAALARTDLPAEEALLALGGGHVQPSLASA